jgi:hypothetical protein
LFELQGQFEGSNEEFDLYYFIDAQGLRSINKYLKNVTNTVVFQEDICALFGPRFDKNGWKYKLQITVEFQGIIKSLYTCVFRKSHVFNETLSLEFAHGVVAENKRIEVNWATYAYLVYKRQQTLEKSRKEK